MQNATKNFSQALHAAYLIAEATALATVFSIELETGEQLYFATSTERELIGHADAVERLPHRARKAKVRQVTAVASIAALNGVMGHPKGSLTMAMLPAEYVEGR